MSDSDREAMRALVLSLSAPRSPIVHRKTKWGYDPGDRQPASSVKTSSGRNRAWRGFNYFRSKSNAE